MALALLHGQMEDVAPEFSEAQQQEEVLANAVAARSRAELESLHALTVGLDDLNCSLASLEKEGLLKGIVPTRLGEAAAAHFLAPEQVATIVKLLGKGKSPLEVAVELESFEALYLKYAERISTKLRMQISQRALHGSFLDLLSSADLRELDNKLQRYCMDFSRDFLRCTCKESPYCGCVQKSISLRILDLRADGKSLSTWAVNIPARELDLRTAARDRIERSHGLKWVEDPARIGQYIREERIGREFWRELLVAGLLLLLLELCKLAYKTHQHLI